MNRENKNKKFHSNGTSYDFNKFRDINQFANDILHCRISIKQEKDEQDEMKEEMAKLENYNSTSEQKVNSKEEVFNNAKGFFNKRNSIIKAVEDSIFPLLKEASHKNQTEKIG